MQQQPDQVPDIYTDAFQVTTTPSGVNMTFSIREAHPSPAKQVPLTELARVRMSPEHAKVVTMMLTKHLKRYERDSGIKIALPANIFTQLGIAEEDWGV